MTQVVSYKQALAILLTDPRKTQIVHLLEKGEHPFRAIKDFCEYDHNQSLSRSLHKLEDAGLVDHSFRHGSTEVYSFYALTPAGREIAQMLHLLEAAGRKGRG